MNVDLLNNLEIQHGTLSAAVAKMYHEKAYILQRHVYYEKLRIYVNITMQY